MDEEEPLIVEMIYPRIRLHSTLTTLAGIATIIFLWKKKYIQISTCILLSITIVLITQFPYWMASHIKFLNSMFYRDYDLVEQPLDFENLTRRLTHEGVEFLEDRHADRAPFLLYMSWLQVHVPLHAGPEFQQASNHGSYGDEVIR